MANHPRRNMRRTVPWMGEPSAHSRGPGIETRMADTRVVCSGAMAQIVALSRDVAKLTAQLESAGVQGDVPETPNPRGKATVRALFSVGWLTSYGRRF